MKAPIQSVEISFFAHATEDQQKILKAVERAIGRQAEPELERLEGHFGNEITKVRIHLVGEGASTAFGSLVSKMGAGLAREVAANVGEYTDEHSALFLRFEKQALVGGALQLGSSDPVRVKVKPRAYLLRGGAPAFYRGVLLGG